MKKLAFAMLTFVVTASGCSSASSSGGTLAPGQVNIDEPNSSVEPPSLPPNGPSKVPPSPPEPIKGCPENREASNVVLTGAEDVRTRLEGIYRGCEGGSGVELRVDPDSDTRLRWYLLDNRFVRVAGTGTSGTLDIGECEGAVCMADSQSDDGSSGSFGTARELTIYDHPTAFRVGSNLSGSPWTDYIRIAD